MKPAIYLDYNASAPVRPQVVDAMAATMSRHGNASSVHRFGRLARRAVEEAREKVAALVGAPPAGVVFTGSGTEANNLALRGVGRRRVLVSAVEHDSVLRAAPGATVAPVDGNGVVDPAAFVEAPSRADEPALVSVMLVNNETGVVQPVKELSRLAREAGALVHCDAVQAAGRLPLDMDDLGVDLLTLSAHKIGGPQGVGALVVRGDIEIAPLMDGGGQERRRRPGTENVAGIVGFAVAADLAREELAQVAGIAALRDELEDRIRAIAPEAVIYGCEASRVANTSCIGLPGVRNEVQVMTLDLAGVAVSAGSACSSGKVTASHVLRAMGADEEAAAEAIRASLGWGTTREDVDRFVEAWGKMHTRLGPRGLGDRAA
ncbi:MAG: cysteine desulfurase family protein [Alphaproteobacteria bacterium]